MRELAQRLSTKSQESRLYQPQPRVFLSTEDRLNCLQQLENAQSVAELLAIYSRQVATLFPAAGCCPPRAWKCRQCSDQPMSCFAINCSCSIVAVG